jgi:hypothetical protein
MEQDRDEHWQDGPQEAHQRDSMDVYTMRLTSWHARMARRLGQGNLSRGVRLAIERFLKIKEPHE